jgi:hypothetical protein
MTRGPTRTVSQRVLLRIDGNIERRFARHLPLIARMSPLNMATGMEVNCAEKRWDFARQRTEKFASVFVETVEKQSNDCALFIS